MWTDAIDASLEDMGGVLQIPSGQWFVCIITVVWNTEQRLHTDEKLFRDLTINYLELAAYVTHFHIFAPIMVPLEHVTTKVDNTVEKGWAGRFRVI